MSGATIDSPEFHRLLTRFADAWADPKKPELSSPLSALIAHIDARITAVPTACQWISASKRLPELHVTVALLDEQAWMNTGSSDHSVNWHGAGYLCEFGQKYWSVFGAGRTICLDAVTHWMPLPEAPAQQAQTNNKTGD